MAKVQAVGVETVNAYGAQDLPASFEVVVNGSNGRGVQVGFTIYTVKNQPLYVSGMLNGSEALAAETALNEANLEYQKIDIRNFGSPGAGDCTIFQLSEVPIGRGNDPLPPQSEDYCKQVVAFVRGQQRVA